MKFVFVLVILASIIFINNAFAQNIGNIDSRVGQNQFELIIVPVTGSSISGCEETADGCYIPKKAIVPIGGKVVFSNTDSVEHTFTANTTVEGTPGVFDSGMISAGNSYEWMPTEAGEFPFHCSIHPWMEGTIIVEETQNQPKDMDGDGIMDDVDSCPSQAETVNGFEDTDGCPDVVPSKDMDSDGIMDDVDSCPSQAETVNGFEDTDGCPDKAESDKGEPVLIYAIIGISVAGVGAAIGIKLHSKGSNGKNTDNIDSNKRDDNQDTPPHVEVRITGGIDK